MHKILVIEDDRKLAIAVGARLRASGYEVIMACDALMGVTVAARQKPDLILLDIAMPLGGGFSVAERLRNIVDTAALPIVFMTAGRDPNLRKRAFEEYGAAGYIRKPFDALDLLAMIREALRRQDFGAETSDMLG
jgi:DNA-binding response OmpR family regulator